MAGEASQLAITARPGGIELRVKVVPGASRSRLAGRLGDALKVAVAAPPEGGKANAALIELLASALGVKRADLAVVSGHGNPLKRVSVKGISVADARARLSGAE
ncbi:MAG: DUF167 domain-containing protein [Phycisphaerae bacterium]|jgi:hypothetical protein|nr:DUF167 domain-containing protein [Phycisphaerae bacterium]HOO16707.1 DUF167 domain-containing protein [Phycisphaerae bacterium]HPC22217.1 DUF167 domain-containing protein [Phycisphaerae bacterium]HRS27023.1 DUF167 domain-containing protein [Phycisphaerae bacterium]HRT42132.1 DUF167 domain-containing protein [Phycisphaerae bacterium]